MFCMFFAYRALIQEIGIEKMGLWSLLIAGVSVSRMVDITGAGGLGRFVAEARSEHLDIRSYIHTVTLATLGLYTLVGFLFLSVGDSLIERFIDAENHEEAMQLLPFAVAIGLFLSPLSATLTSGVDGLGRADLRSAMVAISNILFLLVILFFVSIFGVWAWAAAIISQQIFIIIGAWAVLRAYVPRLGFFPTAWSNLIFMKTLAYGLKLQLNSIASMLSDPLIKLVLNSNGGLTAVALYELGSRFVLALRSIAVQMGTPLIPEFASNRKDKASIKNLLKRASKVTFTFAMVMSSSLLVLSPLYSFLMLTEISVELIAVICVLGVAHGFNVLAIPYYYAGLGLNNLRWNIASQVLMAVCTVFLGVPLGASFGSYGVLAAVSIGLVAGAIMVIFGNKYEIDKEASNGAQ